MEKLNSVTMYMVHTLNGIMLFFNPGEAKEESGLMGRAYKYDEVTLHYHGNGTLDALKNCAPLTAYRAVISATGERTDWYLSMQKADNAVVDKVCEVQFEKAQIQRPYLKPEQLPTLEQLIANERGLFTRMNLHPEVDGFSSRGKIYFPDRSCAEKLCAGPAVITEVKDKGNYGFFTGHMVQYEWPDDNALLEYIEKDGFMNRHMLTFVETEHFGKIVVLSEQLIYESSRYFPCHKALGIYDGELVSITDTSVLSDPGDDIRYVTVADLLCREYMGCAFEDLTKCFIELPRQYSKKLRCRKYDKYVSDLMDDAADSGVVTPMLLEESVFFYELHPYGLLATIQGFSNEELDEIVKTVNRVNMAAQEQISSLAKRGKIRLI